MGQGRGSARSLRTTQPLVLLTALLLSSCAAERQAVVRADRETPTARTSPSPKATATTPAPTPEARASDPSATAEEPARPSGPPASDGRPAEARVSIPRLGLSGLVVIPYRGRTDDARGTDIQNAGDAASPHGPQGGVGPGGIGNYQVTGHRLSSTMPFRYLPQVQRGDEVRVETDQARYVYEVVDTRWTSFRSPESLREQRAAVPGRPGVEPRQAMITLSTCATLEDHAVGNYWADQFDNPEHRIDKIGVLRRVVPL